MKQVLKLSFLSLLILFLSGCQSAMSIFSKRDGQYEKSLQYTKIGTLTYKNSTKAIINITYLNSVDSKKWDDQYQNFLVGIYMSDKNINETFINNPNYKLTLNNNKFISSTVLTKKNSLYNNIPLKNPWAKYYILTFKKDKLFYNNNQILSLKYANPLFGKVQLSFQKE